MFTDSGVNVGGEGVRWEKAQDRKQECQSEVNQGGLLGEVGTASNGSDSVFKGFLIVKFVLDPITIVELPLGILFVSAGAQ